jgi:hypothetical protein
MHSVHHRNRSRGKSLVNLETDRKDGEPEHKPRVDDAANLGRQRGTFTDDGHPLDPKRRDAATACDAPPAFNKLGFTIADFCKSVSISISHYFALQARGLGPRTAKLGSRTIIPIREAERWLAEQVERTAAADATANSDQDNNEKF